MFYLNNIIFLYFFIVTKVCTDTGTIFFACNPLSNRKNEHAETIWFQFEFDIKLFM